MSTVIGVINKSKVRRKSFSIIDIMFAWSGFFCSCGGVFALNIGNNTLALSNIGYIGIILFGFIHCHGKLHISKTRIVGYLFAVEMLFSSIICYITRGDLYASQALAVTIKMVVIVVGMTIFFNNDELRDYYKVFLKFLYYNAIAQMIWSWMEFALYYGIHFSLNDYVYGQVLGVSTAHTLTFVQNGLLRTSGFSWEPANLSLVLMIGFLLANRPIMKWLFALSIFLSTSMTGIFIFCFYLAVKLLLSIRNARISRKKIFSSILVIVIVTIIFIVLLRSQSERSQVVFNRIAGILGISSTRDSSSHMHMGYYYWGPELLFNSPLFNIFFGVGPFMVGRRFSEYFGIYHWLTGLWNPESDVVTIFVGSGIIGTLLYYLLAFKLLRNRKKINDTINFYILLSIIAGGITYLYIRSTWTLLIIFLMTCNPKDCDHFQKKEFKNINGRYYSR